MGQADHELPQQHGSYPKICPEAPGKASACDSIELCWDPRAEPTTSHCCSLARSISPNKLSCMSVVTRKALQSVELCRFWTIQNVDVFLESAARCVVANCMRPSTHAMCTRKFQCRNAHRYLWEMFSTNQRSYVQRQVRCGFHSFVAQILAAYVFGH